ncbi:hypothetical protein [Ectobacillus ponti]|uniref:Uncharacterized protein n=1 Tax=Ectobacillus ponti TaxID=2961894 RepID=A0AA41X7Y8_9BACI|nr:hypothetical protein [Ectobacillus ponti]MCP8970581.1 hypothetical protein [Ectobacillus ponti]
MEVKTTASGDAYVLELRKEKVSVAKRLVGTLWIALGIACFIIAVILFTTIIGIIPAAFICLCAIGCIYLGMAKQKVTCPNCDRTMTVLQRTRKWKCTACKRLALINWIDK